MARNIKTFETLGAVIAAAMFGAKVAGAVQGLVTGVMAIIKVMKLLRTASIGAAAAEALATGGLSAAAGAAAFGVALVGITVATNKFNSDAKKASDNMGDLKFNFNGLSTTAGDYLKGLGKVDSATTKLTADQKKAALQAKELLVVQKQLADKGLVPTSSTDPIELEAVRLNLLKQHNVELDAAYARLVANYEAQMSGNAAAQKYADILGVIADKDISNAEIGLLATKWGESQAAVIAYIASVLGADAYSKTLTDPGAIAAMGWQKALGDLNNYISTLKTVPSFNNPNALAPAGQTGAPSSQGYGSTQAVSDTLRSIDQAVQDALDAAAAADAASAAAQAVIGGLNPTLLAMGQQSADIADSDARLRALSGYSSSTASLGTSTSLFGVSNASTAATGATGSSGVTNIYNVQGSMITSADMTQSMRNNLLQGQLSGQAISFATAGF